MAKKIKAPYLTALRNEIRITRRLLQFGLTRNEAREIYKKVKKEQEKKH